MDVCYPVRVGIENNDPVFDPIVGGVGGVVGAIVGFVVGYFIFKYFLLKKMKMCFDSSANKDFEGKQSDQISTKESKKEGEKVLSNFIMENKTREQTDETENNERELNRKANYQGFHAKCFLDTLLQDSLSKMLIHQIKLTCAELHNVAVASWKDRHKCILLVFKIILNNYSVDNHVTKNECEKILSKAEKILRDMIDDLEVHTKVNHNNKARTEPELSKVIEKFEQLFSTYQRVMKAFEEDLLEVIGFKEASIIHEAIVNCFGKIENKINRHQSHKVQTLMECFYRNLLVFQRYHSGQVALAELMKRRRHYYEVMLRRLSESERISEEENSVLWEKIKKQVEKEFDDVMADFQHSVEKLSVYSNQRRIKVNNTLQLTRKKSMERFLADKAIVSPSRRVQEYFELASELHKQEITASQDLTKNEVFQINELQKQAKSSIQTVYDEMQERFCDALHNAGTLTEIEAEAVMNELTKKNNRASDDIAAINQIQTRTIDLEATLLKSLQNIKDTEERVKEEVEDALRRSQEEEKEKDAKKFISEQSYLTEEDIDAIFDEYKVVMGLFDNQQHIARAVNWFKLDMRLLTLQVETVSLDRQQGMLLSDEDVEKLMKKLDKQRTEFELRSAGSYGQFDVPGKISVGIKERVLAQLVAEGILNNLLPNAKEVTKKKESLKRTKESFLEVSSKYSISDDQLEKLFATQESKIREIQGQVQYERDIEAQVLKERQNAEYSIKVHRLRSEVDDQPLSASSLNTNDLLQRLFDQERNKQEVEKLERKKEIDLAKQIYLLRIGIHDKLEAALQEVDKSTLCKTAKLIGMKKNDFVHCIEDGLSSVGENSKKKAVTDILQYWNKDRRSRLQLKSDERLFTTRPKPKKAKKILKKL